MKVIGVGDADIDIYLEVDHVPGRDEKVLARTLRLIPGGMVANFLVALSRLGVPCAFHGVVGDDEFGQLTLADLSANHVDVSHALVKDGRTYFCVVMLDPGGEKSLVVAPTGCLFPLPEDISEEAIAGADHIHTTSGNLATAMRCLTIAREHGLTTSLDLEATVIEQGEKVMDLISRVDVLFLNKRALDRLDQQGLEVIRGRQFLGHRPQIVCVTMGEEGVLVLDSSGEHALDAFQVDVTDTTGAGDCFAAGFVYGFLHGWSPGEAAKFSNAVAALSTTQTGGHAGAPTREEVESFLVAHDAQLPG
jgi:sugar/nucleoside kinase (ribokinase family)